MQNMYIFRIYMYTYIYIYTYTYISKKTMHIYTYVLDLWTSINIKKIIRCVIRIYIYIRGCFQPNDPANDKLVSYIYALTYHLALTSMIHIYMYIYKNRKLFIVTYDFCMYIYIYKFLCMHVYKYIYININKYIK